LLRSGFFWELVGAEFIFPKTKNPFQESKMKLALVVISTLIITSCAYVPYARESKKKPREGGIISLKSDHRPEDRQKAEQLMAQNCGGSPVKILEEGEVTVGQSTSSTARKTNDNGSSGFKIGGLNFGGSSPGENTNGTSETTQLREWQISYTCEHPAAGRRK
jgi:hypothetical protein